MNGLGRERFQSRHIGPNRADAEAMLKVVGAGSLDALIDEAIEDVEEFPHVLEVKSRRRLVQDVQRPAGPTL